MNLARLERLFIYHHSIGLALVSVSHDSNMHIDFQRSLLDLEEDVKSSVSKRRSSVSKRNLL